MIGCKIEGKVGTKLINRINKVCIRSKTFLLSKFSEFSEFESDFKLSKALEPDSIK